MPEDAPESSEWHVIRIPKTWQLIATMNVFDKSLLFKMSFALMRRFAFIEVPAPSNDVFVDLIRIAAEDDETAVEVARSLLSLRKIKDTGPAIFIDLATFAKNRLVAGSVTTSELTLQCFYSYLLPQFEGIDDVQASQLQKQLSKSLDMPERRKLRQMLRDVLGVEVQGVGVIAEVDEEEDADWGDLDEEDEDAGG
ncbi:MAG: hypothetical protein H0U13_13800 [Gemmatimonadaceae bacterium]|nr:hypothetical protein [Gemmatimonadaceae bacterium]